MKPPLILIDVGNLAFRSGFVFKGLSYEEQPTGAIYGFLRTLRDLRRQFQGELVLCWDYGLPGSKRVKPWRHKIFPTYKSDRSASEDKQIILAQFPLLFKASEILGWQSVGVPGLEADDIMALLIRSAKPGQPVYLYTGDRDLYQVLCWTDEEVAMVGTRQIGGRYPLKYQMDIEREHNISVEDWAAYLALGGDASDSIHVMPGVGPVTAKKIVAAGARLDWSWEKQPPAVQNRYPKCKPYWKQLQAGFEVARLPMYPVDERIASYVKGYTFDLRGRKRAKGALDQFMSFCSDLGLMEFLVQRHEFTGEQK